MSEIQSIISTSTAIIVDRKEVSRDRSMPTGKLVFKRKTNADGSLDKYKARWTARGFTRLKGLD